MSFRVLSHVSRSQFRVGDRVRVYRVWLTEMRLDVNHAARGFGRVVGVNEERFRRYARDGDDIIHVALEPHGAIYLVDGCDVEVIRC